MRNLAGLILILGSCTFNFPDCVSESKACSEQAAAWCLATNQSGADCSSAYESECQNGQKCVSYEEQIVCLAELDQVRDPPLTNPPLACQVTWFKH